MGKERVMSGERDSGEWEESGKWVDRVWRVEKRKSGELGERRERGEKGEW